MKSEAALRVVTPLLEAPVANRRNWTIARLISEIEAREGVHGSAVQLLRTLRKKTSAGEISPRHTLKVARWPARSRAWLRLPTAQGPSRGRRHRPALCDESEALTHPSRRGVQGQARRRSARAGAGTSQKSGDDRLARSSRAQVDRAHQPDQAQQRLHRSPGATRPSLWPPTRTSHEAGRAGRGQ